MADELNFSIEETMERGIGSSELLNDLMSPETSTGDPKELTEIVKNVEDPPKKKDEKPKGKEIVQKLPGEENSAQDILKNFLGDTSDDDIIEEEIIDEEKPKDDDGGEDDPSKKDNTYNALKKDLRTLGVFSSIEEGEEDPDITSPQEFLEVFQAESKKSATDIVDKFIGQFGEDYQNAFEAIYVNGVNPKDYFSVYNTITDFASLDMTLEENQIQVIKQGLKEQEWEAEDITDEIERLTNSGDLEAVSTRYHKSLVKKGAINLQQMEQKAAQELKQKVAIKEQYSQNVKQVIQDKLKTKEYDGIPINLKIASELQDFLLTDKWKLPSGETLTDFDRAILELKKPENHAQKVKLGLILKTMEKDPTLSSIVKSGITKKTDELFGNLAKQKKETRSSVPNTTKDTVSWFAK